MIRNCRLIVLIDKKAGLTKNKAGVFMCCYYIFIFSGNASRLNYSSLSTELLNHFVRVNTT